MKKTIVIALSVMQVVAVQTISIACDDKPCKQAHLAKIAKNEKSFSSLPEEAKYQSKQSAFNELKEDSSMVQLGTSDDLVLHHFYDSLKTTNIGKIAAINDLIAQGEFATAKSINAQIVIENYMEANYKAVYDIYLNTIAQNTFVYSAADSTTLKNIAYQNPIHGGNAVYSARVMLGIDVADFADEQEYSGSGKRDASHDKAVPVVEGNTSGIEQTKEIQFESFPNPFSNKTTIQLSVPESSRIKLEIFNITGEQKEIIFEGNAEQNKIYTIEYDSKNLAAGVYFYKLSSDSEIMNKKVVIIR